MGNRSFLNVMQEGKSLAPDGNLTSVISPVNYSHEDCTIQAQQQN
jgi:hypothetical protein